MGEKRTEAYLHLKKDRLIVVLRQTCDMDVLRFVLRRKVKSRS